jgi:hypothetical protein
MIYKVLITETVRYTAEVEANSPEEAKEKAYENNCAGEYDIDSSDDREETYTIDTSLGNDSLICPKCGTKMDEHEFADEDGYFDGWGWVCPNCAHIERNE